MATNAHERIKRVENVRRRLAELGMRQRELHKKVPGRSPTTIDNFFLLRFSEHTAQAIERALGIEYAQEGALDERAAPEFGGYSKFQHQAYLGRYIYIRPVFSNSDEICAFEMHIQWSNQNKCLVIKGEDETKNTVLANICIPIESRYINFLNIESGFSGLSIVSTIDHNGYMFGMLLTLGYVGGNNYMPACVPVVLIQLRQNQQIEGAEVGRIFRDNASYVRYSELLGRVSSEGYGIFKRTSEPV